jgi:hypothetical protein
MMGEGFEELENKETTTGLFEKFFEQIKTHIWL